MKLEIEGRQPIENPSAAHVRAAISSLRSYGPSSFASLTDEDGSYFQVAGGGMTCMLERRDNIESRHFRAFKEEKSKVFADGTILSFSGGEIRMHPNEWMTASDVEAAFLAFLNGDDLPKNIKWRDISYMFS